MASSSRIFLEQIDPSGASTGYYIKWDGTNWVPAANPGIGVTDGDKGDITVSGTGTIWSLDAATVTLAKMANLAPNSIIGNNTGSSATPLALSGTQVTALLDLASGTTKGLLSSSDFTKLAAISGTNTGDQTITLTGNVTGSGTGSFATTIASNAVTLANMAQVATATFLGRTTAATGNVEALTTTQATALLNAFTTTVKGLVPAAGTATGKYLRDDGTWALTTFQALSDATDYVVGDANKPVVVNSGGTGITFGTSALGTAAYSATSAFAAAVHTHVIADVTGLQTALDAKLASSAVSAYGLTLIDDADAATARTTLGLGTAATAASSSFAAASHTHAMSDIVGLTAALAAKEPTITSGSTTQYWRGDKTWQTLDKTAVGLANVDNTSDVSKPISTATQTALDLKAPLASPTFTGTVTLAQDPVLALQAATKQYVDSVAQGLDVKASVLVATTANITLSGEQTIDGITTSASRILVKNQTTTTANGIYVTASGAWTRALDFDSWLEVPGSFVFVERGTTLSDTGWVCSSDQGGTLGSTAITWTQFSGAGAYTANGGITQSGTNFALTAMGANTIKGNNTGSTAAPIDLTGTQVTTLLDLATGSIKGLLSSSDFTKLAGIAPGAQTGTVTSTSVTTANGVSGTVATPTTTPAITITLGAITPTSIVSSGSISGTNLSGTNTGDQTITLTGNVTGSGTGSFATTIASNAVTLANLAQVSTAIFLGRTTAATGNVEALTTAQATAMLNSFTTALQGLVPASGGGTANFLRADGTWTPPTASAWGSITGTLSNQTDLQSALNAKAPTASPTFTGTTNAAIITASGAITGSNLSGTNTGDQTISLTGDITGSGTGSFTTAIGANKVTLAQMAQVATGSVFYRKTAATGNVETQTLATLKTDLGLTGTNTGDQTITLTGDVTGSGTGSFATAIGANKVTNAMLAQVATASFQGRTTAATGNVETLTATQATALLDLVIAAGAKGLMSGSDKTKLDGIAAGAQTGTVTSVSVTTANGVSGSVATSTSTPAITLSLGAITPSSVASTGAVTGTNLSGTNTGDQTITLTGDITGSGTGSFATAIGANKVTLAQIAQVSTATFLGRTTASTGNVESLTATQATALLDSFTTSLKGLVPASGGGTTNFLRADGTWAAPAGGGGGTTTNALTLDNSGTGATSGSTFNGSTAVTLSYNTLGAAPAASPTFTGTVTIPTPTADTNSTAAASTAFVQTSLATVSISTTGGATTITSAQAGAAVILITGTLTSNATISFGSGSAAFFNRAYTVVNNTTGAFTVTLQACVTSPSGSVLLSQGRTTKVYTSSAVMGNAANDAATMTINGAAINSGEILSLKDGNFGMRTLNPSIKMLGGSSYTETLEVRRSGTNAWQILSNSAGAPLNFTNLFPTALAMYLGGTGSPQHMLEFAAGGSSFAPIRLGTSGAALLTTPVSGVIETDGTGLFWTNNSAARNKLYSAADAASANTNSTLVLRDGSGNFSAGTITAALSGNATTATSATSATSATTAGSVTNAVTFNTTGGAAAGTTFNGSVARTIDYSTVGAAATGLITASGLTVATATFVGRNSALTGAVEALSATTATAMLNPVVAGGAQGVMTGADKTKLNGIATGANTGTVTSVTLTQPAAGITLTNTGTSQTTTVTSTVALSNDLAAVEGLSTTGIVRRTATDTWSAGTSVALSEVATQAAATLLGNNTGSSASPTALTVAQARTLLGLNYGFGSFFGGLGQNAETVAGYIAPTSFTISGSNTSAKATIAATASTVYTINNVSAATTVGTLTFAAAATTATVSITSGSITAGQFITITGPATADTTLANVAFRISD